ncbi:hypothetical protein PHYPO_G00011760 [Pangasianodon hypophthalmus]|uniref:Protein FAM98A n=1 Tax=Pangasianodon hypophthalmus TaxID=310915 RepID=A0A5N5N398_PANHP|nr:hypothetical protein PHYPO_G00011760 [Pangasianodon hypophthalmus]
MENDILDSLEDLGYQGPLLEDGALQAALSGGAASPEFTKLCAWLVSELKLYCRLEEDVHATNSQADGFQLEMSGLLTELACPYSCLTRGDVTHRLLNANNCQLLLTFLISELEAARMAMVNAPQRKAQDAGGTVGCSELFLELKGICVALGMSKPPSNITMFQFFSGIEKKLKEALSKVPPRHVGGPLMNKTLGPLHWEKIEAINQALVNEYEVRRKMLLKRLDVTVQSFGWSDRAKSQTEKLAKVYQPLRSALGFKSRVCVAHLLAAREDLSKILRTSSGQTREKTSCAINKVLMGRVPDRGGRPNEIEPPPPEMPTWQKRQDGPTGGGGGRGGGRGGYDQHQGGRGGGGRGDRGGKVGNKGKEDRDILEEDIKAGTKVKDTKVEVGIKVKVTKVEVGIKVKVTKVEGVIKVKDTKVEGTKEGIKGKDTKVEGIKGVTKGRATLVEVTKGVNKVKKVVTKVTTKMEGDNRSAEEVEGVVEGEDEEDEVGKAEAGVEEGGRILTKEGSLSSSSNMAGISITRRGSGRGFTPAELARDYWEMTFRTRIDSRSYKGGWL